MRLRSIATDLRRMGHTMAPELKPLDLAEQLESLAEEIEQRSAEQTGREGKGSAAA